MHIFLRRFFSITLFLMVCPLIFAKSQKPSQQEEIAYNQAPTEQEIQQMREIFEQLMVQARNQTQVIGSCIQQILLTLNADKLKMTSEQKSQITEDLLQIQDLTNMMLENLFVQNSTEALFQGILINNVLICYLLETVQTDIKTINASKVHDLLVKKSNMQISEELLFKLASINREKIEQLEYAVDHIGLTWSNHLYRTLKKYNAYSIVKACGIMAATSLVAAIILCKLDCARDWVGANPQKVSGQAGHQITILKADGSTEIDTTTRCAKTEYLDPSKAGYIQKICMGIENLSSIGLITTGALLSLNYKEILGSMWQDPYNWFYDISAKKVNDIDKQLQGTAKANVNNEGWEKVYFKDMVGCKELEQLARKIANFMKHPERYERAHIEEHRGILLYGPPQTGKTLFAKALRTLIEEELGDEQRLHFLDAKKYYDAGYSIEYIFWYATFYAPCIIFFDEIDMVGARRDTNPITTSQLLTCMQGIDMASKQVIVIGATNRPEQLDKALLVDGRFGKIIHIEYPKYEDRKAYLEQQLAKRCIRLNPEYVDYIAQETEGCSYNNLKRIITEAIILSSIETRPVTQQDFERTLDIEVRRIQPATNMSAQERKVIAIYQAGKALVRHLLKTVQEVVKITTNPVIKEVKPTDVALVIDSNTQKTSDNDKLASNKKDQRIKLGEVFTKCPANHQDLLSDTEQEKECLALLAGGVALQLLTQEKFTQCNKHDRAEVMQMIYGMISQGEKIDDKLKAEALEIKEKYEQQVHEMLLANQELLQKIIDLLMAQETIDRYEWKALVS